MSSTDVRRTTFPRKSRIRWDPALSDARVSSSPDHASDQNGINGGPHPTHYNENTTLLGFAGFHSSVPSYGAIISRKFKTVTLPDSARIRAMLNDTARASLWAIPAVILGSLLNILDGVSYGMIIFPSSAPFTDLGPMGVSMFFITCVLSQLCFTFGGSGFAGANGSMMIEVVPFYHIMAARIASDIGEDKPAEVIATTIVAYALSSVLTGLSFLLLGALRLGALIGFFPRHILVGCIGGVGAFLIETGLTVSMRIPDDDFNIDLETLKFMFLESQNLALWTIPLALAIVLRLITSKWSHQLIFPVYFVVIPLLFYVVVAAARLNLDDLRQDGWLFSIPGGVNGESDSWWKFYTYFDRSLIHIGPLWAILPTQFALLFFNILHPPLNVPALAVSLNEDVDTNKELVAHGYSNLLAGAFGTVPNYLVYVNTLLFYRVGGSTRVAGFLLAVATTVLLLVGTGPIAYIPVPVVGALIFVLGIDLVKEALWDTRHRVSRTEYLTILSIIIAMTVWDFVIGVLFGIVVSCFFFVVQNSQRRSIRAIYTGENIMSTVRRPSAQRAYLKEVSKQTTILRLQGFLFFGTITYVEEAIRNIIDTPSWQRNPVRFLVVDLTLVAGVDMSAAEAFVRVQRLLAAKYVTLVFCGFTVDSPVGKALNSVGVTDSEGVELFSTLNDAMEWTENVYLKAYFRSQKMEMNIPFVFPGRQDVDVISSYQSSQSSLGSPRRLMLFEAGSRTIANEIPSPPMLEDTTTEPFLTLVRAFSSFRDFDFSLFRSIVPYFQRMSVPEGFVLWHQGDNSDGLYLIESGVLRASYQFTEYAQNIEESMVPGTLAGELSALSDLPRNATVVVERPAVLWKLSTENLRRLELEEPNLARMFTHMVLKSAKIDYDTLLAALAGRQ
ncbi:sulfate transporter family-domain-containing protein [Lentinula raphanica]|nr:sulfate transporter family-domain-containing protein [Lentinula raphanica]